MNDIERHELLAAAAETFPAWRFDGLEAALAPLSSGGAWSVWVGPGGFADAAWERELDGAGGLAEALGLGAAFLPPGRATAGVRWDAANGRVASAWVEAGGRRLERAAGQPTRSSTFKRHRFSAGLFAEPGLAASAASFHARCPVDYATVEFEGEGKNARPTGRWSLALRRPEPWPRLLRLDLAGAFAPEHASLTFLLLARRVRELAFEGETPRARLGA